MSPEAAYSAGLDAIGTGGEAQAIAGLQAALQRAPGEARLWQVLGLLHRAQEDLAPAVEALARAAALAPRDPLILHGHAQARLEAGLPAVDAFEDAVAAAPDKNAALLGLAAALAAQGAHAAAIARLDAQIAQQPGWGEGHWLASRLRWMSGERGDHLYSLDRALAAHPREPALWQLRIMIQMRGMDFAGVLRSVADARRSLGSLPLFDLYAALARSESGDARGADAALARADAGTDLSILLQLIRHELRIGRPDRAAERALPLTQGPAAVHAWPYLALAWRLTGDPRWQWLEGDPRLIGIYDLTPDLPPIEPLAAHLRTLHAGAAHPLEQSVRGGTQTDGPLLSRIAPEIRALRAAIVSAVERHIAQLPPPDPAHPQLSVARSRPVRFAGSWSVRLRGGGHHVNHIHPEGWFSSAFYAALPAPQDRGAPPAGWLAIGEPEEALGLDLAALREIEPAPGRLVLFPSTMWHGTRPFGAGERLTVAFDVQR